LGLICAANVAGLYDEVATASRQREPTDSASRQREPLPPPDGMASMGLDRRPTPDDHGSVPDPECEIQTFGALAQGTRL
jgi:hypothetical protein